MKNCPCGVKPGNHAHTKDGNIMFFHVLELTDEEIETFFELAIRKQAKSKRKLVN